MRRGEQDTHLPVNSFSEHIMHRLTVSFCLVVVFCPVTVSIASAGHQPAGESFQSNGVTIHYSIQGENNGEPVILLHGWLGRGEGLFDMKFSRSLLEDGYRLVVPDQRGHGKSDKPHDDGQYGVEMVSDVIRLMDHLQIEKAHVIGYSMGGFVVGKLLVEHPNRIKSAVIGANGGLRSGDYSEFVQAFSKAVAAGKKAGDALIEHYELAGFPPMNEGLGQYFIELNQSDASALAAVARGWKDLALSADELRAIKTPTLVIHGARDNAFGIDSARRFHELVPTSRLIVVQEHDHESTLTSDVFAAEVHKFVNEVSRGAVESASDR